MFFFYFLKFSVSSQNRTNKSKPKMLLSSMSPQKKLVEKKKITASAGRYSWGGRKIKPHSSCNPKETNKKTRNWGIDR